jgi:hypothetical protein
MIDVVSDELLPAPVGRVVLEPCERGRKIVAVDEMEEVAAAAPDPPVPDAGSEVGLDQVIWYPPVREIVCILAACLED